MSDELKVIYLATPKIKDSLERGGSFITKETELPKGKMLETDDESVRKMEFKNRYNRKRY